MSKESTVQSNFKIACIGNMNNMLFTFCRYLRDEGLDVDLYTFNNEPFKPDQDSYSMEFKKYTYNLDFDSSKLTDQVTLDKIKNTLSNYNFFIGIDIAPALMTLLNLRLDIFVPHGTDIYRYPFVQKRKKGTSKLWWLKEVKLLSKLQKIGIESSKWIFFPDEYELNFPYKSKLDAKGTFCDFSVPMVYMPEYSDKNIEINRNKLKYYKKFQLLRDQNDLLIFSHSRHNGWNLAEKSKIQEKGNEYLIQGFADFNEVYKGSSHLILFDYGMNVKASKDLIKSLQIEKKVTWMPKMSRKEIMVGLSMSDISCGILKNSWLTCGVVNESLAVGTPLLHSRNDVLYKKNYKWLYPILKASSSEEVTLQLITYSKEINQYNKFSDKGKEWLKEFSIKPPLNKTLEILNQEHQKQQINNKSLIISTRKILRSYKRQLILTKIMSKLFGTK